MPAPHPPAEFEGDDSETMVVEEGVKVPPPPPDVNKSMLDGRALIAPGAPFVIAIALHILVFGAAIVLPQLWGNRQQLHKPIIAKLVALGKPRDEKLLPRKEEQSAPPPASHGVDPVVLTAKPAPKVASAEAKAPAPRPLSHKELMERALAGAAKNVEQEHKDKPLEEREGKEDGSADGTAATAEEGDQYFGAVQAAILAHYVLPSIISEGERMTLKATVVAYIGRDGSIVRYEFEKRSGNKFFDDALELAMKRSKVPPPPPQQEKLVREGIALQFTP